MTSARRFTIAFAAVALFGLVVSVVIPVGLPGPKWLTISAGSACFILILVAGGRLLRRRLLRLQAPGGR